MNLIYGSIEAPVTHIKHSPFEYEAGRSCKARLIVAQFRDLPYSFHMNSLASFSDFAIAKIVCLSGVPFAEFV
jgi:hypothetical protein